MSDWTMCITDAWLSTCKYLDYTICLSHAAYIMHAGWQGGDTWTVTAVHRCCKFGNGSCSRPVRQKPGTV